jgi:hypothetical protein
MGRSQNNYYELEHFVGNLFLVAGGIVKYNEHVKRQGNRPKGYSNCILEAVKFVFVVHCIVTPFKGREV